MLASACQTLLSRNCFPVTAFQPLLSSLCFPPGRLNIMPLSLFLRIESVLFAMAMALGACGAKGTVEECPAGLQEPFEERPCGAHIECACDATGRVERIETHEADAPHALVRRRYHYDGPRLVKVDETRRGPNVSIEIGYDEQGRRNLLKEETVDSQGQHMLVERRFDYENGRVVREHTTASSSLHLDYDLRNVWEGERLVRREIDERRDGDFDFVESYSFNDAGERIASETTDAKDQVLLRCTIEHCPSPHRGCPTRCDVLDGRFDVDELRFD